MTNEELLRQALELVMKCPYLPPETRKLGIAALNKVSQVTEYNQTEE